MSSCEYVMPAWMHQSVCFVNSGAQSDSEVVEAAVVADGSSDRGYTSDSELYDAPKRDSPLSSSDTKLKPSSGSWLMVSWGKRIGSRPSDHYFRSVCLFVCLFVCLCRVFLRRL